MLNDEQMKTLWPGIKIGLRNMWGRLSEKELDASGGDFSVIGDLVKEKYNVSQEEVRKKLDQLLMSFDNETDKGVEPDVSSYRRSPVADDWNARH